MSSLGQIHAEPDRDAEMHCFLAHAYWSRGTPPPLSFGVDEAAKAPRRQSLRLDELWGQE